MKREWFRVGMGILVLVALFSLVGLGQPVAPKGIIIEPPDASGLSVRIWVDKGAYTVGETIQVHFEVNEDAYVYLDDIDAAGRVTRLFPNQYSSNNFVRAGEHVLPDLATYKLTVTDPTGTEYLQIIATKRQLDALPGFQLSVPFPLFGGDPETFKLKIEGQIMGIIPEPQWTQDWTSFEVVSGDAPAYGTLIVNSVPSGAWIALDGAYVGYTSRTLYIRQGYHQVVISKEGYRDWRRAVFIIGGLTRIINATLEPSPSVNQPPVASFAATPGFSTWIHFDASASYDPDGTIVSYSWDFGDRSSGTGVSEWHRYTAPGTYTVTLTVTDDDGATDTEVRTVQVGPTNQPPVASFTVSPPSPGIGEWVRFDASASYDSDGSITSYSWDFGDRTSGTGVSEWHRYTAPGTYTVTLTVTDDEGATDTEVRAVQVGPTNQPPVASFTVSPPSPVIGEQIVLNATSSYDPDGTIVSHFWDLDGDGSDDTSGQIAHVRYYSAGIARVRLTVVDNTGLSSTVTQQITVGGGGGVPGGPPMGGNPGIFVWGTNTWHVTVNAGSTWTSPRSYRLELHTDGNFQNVNQSTSSGVAPLGIVPTPTEGGKALLFEGNLQSGSVDYTFSVSNAKSIWMSLKLDMDGDGDLEESPSFVYLRYAMVHPPAAPFVVGLPKGSSGPLVPSTNFRIGRALQYTSAVRFIMWLTDIATLEGY